MAENDQSEVLMLAQPDLFTKEDLVEMIQKRCCRVQNLETMSKNRLVELFRRIILPLPQRFYGTNRRGKLLTARRAKAGLEGSKREEPGDKNKKFSSNDRLKPPPDSSRLKDNSQLKLSKGSDSRFNNRDKRKFDEEEEKRWRRRQEPPDLSPNKKITLKRSSGSERQERGYDSDGKRQRTAIKWP